MEKKMVNVTGKLSILFLCFAWFIWSCATIEKSIRPVVFQKSYEGISAGEVYNGCIKAVQKRELPLLSIDKAARLISTDWIYFKKPGINLKYRYRFDLNISESTDKKVEFLLKCEYQRGTPLYPNPINPLISGYDWKRVSSDKHLEKQLDLFFQEVEESLKRKY